mgnify:CR=1 FL=1
MLLSLTPLTTLTPLTPEKKHLMLRQHKLPHRLVSLADGAVEVVVDYHAVELRGESQLERGARQAVFYYGRGVGAAPFEASAQLVD